MKVKQLIKRLQAMPQNLDVDFSLIGQDADIIGPYHWREIARIEHMDESKISLECDPYVLIDLKEI